MTESALVNGLPGKRQLDPDPRWGVSIEARLASRANSFDLIRIVAAWLVLFSHSYALTGRGRQDEPLWLFTGCSDFGSLALDVFFIVSGFLVTRSWMSDPHPGRYLKRRMLRILPALVAGVLLAILVLGPAVTRLRVGEYFRAAGTWTYLQNCSMYRMQYELPGVFESHTHTAVNGSLWSLRVEFTMYLLVIALGVTRLIKPRVLIIILAGLLVIDWQVFGGLVPREARLFIINAGNGRLLAYFLAGALLVSLSSRVGLDWRLFLFCCVVWAASMRREWWPFVSLFTLPYIVIFLGLQKPPRFLNLARFGDISYGVYIYAFPVQQAILEIMGRETPMVLFIPLATVLTVLLAICSWHLIERPALQRKPARPCIESALPCPALSTAGMGTGPETPKTANG